LVLVQSTNTKQTLSTLIYSQTEVHTVSKKAFVKPEMSIIALETADIITTSQPFNGEWVPIEVEPANDFLIS